MSQLRLIETNPTTESLQRGIEHGQQIMARDIQMEGQMRQNVENMAAAPHRLRTIEAQADNAQSQSRVQQATEPYQIQKAPIEVDQARASVESTRANTRATNAATLNTEMQGFFKSLELLNAGNVDAAQEVARRTGQTIPPEVVQSQELRGAITSAARNAQQLYPNRPRDQQQYIQGFIKSAQERRAQGGSVSDPTMIHNVPDAPVPQEISTQNRGSVYQAKYNAWLSAHPADTNGALAYASGRKIMTQADRMNMASQMAAREFQGQFMVDPAKKQQRTQELYQELINLDSQPNEGVPQPSTTTPAARPAAPAPAAAPVVQSPMQGGGTREQPYEATTQEQVEWFKQNAPAGSVLRANGQLFQK
jgi:hypothetical protein